MQTPPFGKQPTLRDVAAAAGVDASTVSKILSGDRISVRPETRARVLEKVEELGYRPDARARGLRLRRRGGLGLLLPDLANPLHATIARGAIRRANSRGYSLLLAEIAEPDSDDAYRLLVQEKRIDGLLVATSHGAGGLTVDLRRDHMPHVFVNRRGRGDAPSVTVDDEAGAALAARTLAEHGHRSVAAVNGPPDVDTAQRRWSGFRAEVRELGLTEPLAAAGESTAAGGHQAMTELLSAGPRPTAVFVSSFAAAVGALRAAADLGVRVPDELSVVTFDDGQIADYTIPSLTSVRMPFEEMGSAAVDTLLDHLAGAAPADVVVATAPVLQLRESLAGRDG